MNTLYRERLNIIKHNQELLKKINIGIEKETLRIDYNACLSTREHPISLGHTLTHPYITTDYSEALLEFITPVYQDIESLFNFIGELHSITSQNLTSELLWAGSMPPVIENDESIPIAQYGQSNLGKLKSLYRKGLAVRYGKSMQTIAGIHYNFSLPQALWSIFKEHEDPDSNFIKFQSNQYLGIIRNFQRFSWLLMYLFGTSPCIDKSFFKGKISSKTLYSLSSDTYLSPFATSLRMSDIGYNNISQAQLKIDYDSLPSYIKTLTYGMTTPYPEFVKIGNKNKGEFIQINTNLLQIENEYYNNIRPKRNSRREEKPLQTLQKKGIEYVEIRCIDLNPNEPYGLSKNDAYFLNTFLMYCALKESPYLKDTIESKEIKNNLYQATNFGRKKNLTLKHHQNSILLKDFGCKLIDDMVDIAKLLDESQQTNKHIQSLNLQIEKLESLDKIPSTKFLSQLYKYSNSYKKTIKEFSIQYKNYYMGKKINNKRKKFFHKIARESINKEKKLTLQDTVPFDQYLKLFNENKL